MLEKLTSLFRTNSMDDIKFEEVSDNAVDADHGGVPQNTIASTKPDSLFDNVPSVNKAVRLRQEAMASVPMLVANRETGEPVSGRGTSPLVGALRRMDVYSTIVATEGDLLVHGFAVWRVSPGRAVADIVRIPARNVTPPSPDSDRAWMATMPGGARVVLNRDNLVVFKEWMQDDRFESPMTALKKSMELIMWSREASTVSHRNFGNIGKWVVSLGQNRGDIIPINMKNDEVQTISDAINGKADGSSPPTGRVVFTRGSVRATSIGASRDTEFDSTQFWGTQEVARVMRVPIVLLDSLESATYSNLSELRADWYNTTIRSRLIFYENAIARQLSELFTETLVFDKEALKELIGEFQRPGYQGTNRPSR